VQLFLPTDRSCLDVQRLSSKYETQLHAREPVEVRARAGPALLQSELLTPACGHADFVPTGIGTVLPPEDAVSQNTYRPAVLWDRYAHSRVC